MQSLTLRVRVLSTCNIIWWLRNWIKRWVSWDRWLLTKWRLLLLLINRVDFRILLSCWRRLKNWFPRAFNYLIKPIISNVHHTTTINSIFIILAALWIILLILLQHLLLLLLLSLHKGSTPLILLLNFLTLIKAILMNLWIICNFWHINFLRSVCSIWPNHIIHIVFEIIPFFLECVKFLQTTFEFLFKYFSFFFRVHHLSYIWKLSCPTISPTILSITFICHTAIEFSH